MLHGVPLSSLEARYLAARLWHVVSWDLFNKEYPMSETEVAKVFVREAARAEQLAGPTHLLFGFAVYVRRYFIALQQLLSGLLAVSSFLTLKTWVACNGKRLDVSKYSDPLDGFFSVMTEPMDPGVPKMLRIDGKLLHLLVCMMWLHGKYTDVVSVVLNRSSWLTLSIMIVS